MERCRSVRDSAAPESQRGSAKLRCRVRYLVGCVSGTHSSTLWPGWCSTHWVLFKGAARGTSLQLLVREPTFGKTKATENKLPKSNLLETWHSSQQLKGGNCFCVCSCYFLWSTSSKDKSHTQSVSLRKTPQTTRCGV